MRIESKLCHISENKAVVKVNGWINDKDQGSALAEGPTVEMAEDKAISRLNNRLNGITYKELDIKSINDDKIKKSLKVELPKNAMIENENMNININDEPSDWSNELTQIDSEIQRLKWSREDEIEFLEKTLGYNQRNKITSYTDILRYLSLLKKTNNDTSTKVVNININTLIEESDTILRDLSWNHVQGREYLQKEFNVSTRKELNEKQLISFIKKLTLLRDQYKTH